MSPIGNPKWSKAWQWGWISVLSVLGVYELWSWIDRDPATPTLTKFLLFYVPWWVVVPFFIWLVLHFARRYLR